MVHLVEYVDELIKNEAIKLNNNVDLQLTYHDSCSLARLSEPWVPWEGERGLWGVVSPTLERRRGTNGVYQQPRDILSAIPGVKLVEPIRKRENTFCCGAGRGTKEAFPDFALWSAQQKLTEVKEVGAEAVISACPWCKNNFAQAADMNGGEVKALDISEIILESLCGGGKGVK